MREFLLKVASRSGIAEDDALYAVIAAHGDMLDEKLKTVHEQLAKALNGAGNKQADHTEHIEATRAEIEALAMIVRSMGESLSKVERRFQIVGDTLTKFEQRTADIEKRLTSIDITATTFHKLKTAQIWQALGTAFLLGAVIVFAVHLLGWLSTTAG